MELSNNKGDKAPTRHLSSANRTSSTGNGVISCWQKNLHGYPPDNTSYCQGYWLLATNLMVRPYYCRQLLHNSLNTETLSCCLPRASSPVSQCSLHRKVLLCMLPEEKGKQPPI